jgi:hypothetical protein
MAETTNSLPPVSLPALLRGALRRRTGGAGVHSAARSETVYRMAGIDVAQLAAYSDVLGFPPGAVPITFYYLIAQRAHVAAMVHPAFPFRLAGMIHVANVIEEFAMSALPSLDATRELVVRNALTIEPPTGSGARYCVFETFAEQDGTPIFRCESRYLAVRGERRPKVKLALDGALGAPVGAWSLPAYEGRLYAKASGDWNPIHLWPWSARLMGLQKPIIHGMHTVGKACALLEQASGRRVIQAGASFVAPIPLGSEVRLEADWQQGRYYVLTDRLAVEGSFVVL